MTAVILRGDARNLPLADASVDLIVTSPPYFALRSYTDGGEHYHGQIGAEPTPAEYVAALLDCTAEWMRVLKPSGSLWVNLGDKYSGNETGGRLEPSGSTLNTPANMPAQQQTRTPYRSGLRPKSLIGLPWRYALGCIDQLGLILRAEVIWSKENPLPESVRDRVRRSHEQFFHFTKQPRYFAAVDEIRQPHRAPGRIAGASAFGARDTCITRTGTGAYEGPSPLGALPGSVWEVATQPLKVPQHLEVDHFAAYPPALIRPIILGWSPSGICTECGEGRRPVAQRTAVDGHAWAQSQQFDRIGQEAPNRRTPSALGYRAAERDMRITGCACACPAPAAPTRPSVVLDPFGGTGTTTLVADVLGRHGISIDRSADYCRLAQWRTQDPRERARALGVKPPEPVAPEQCDLFEEIA